MLKVDTTSSVPVYAQIVEQVKRAIATGVLPKGAVLPSRRDLALRLEINPLTVLKAYKQLEGEGLIDVRQGLGCFVAAEPEEAVEGYRMQTLVRAMDNLIADAGEFGVPRERVMEMFHERMELARNGSEEPAGAEDEEQQ